MDGPTRYIKHNRIKYSLLYSGYAIFGWMLGELISFVQYGELLFLQLGASFYVKMLGIVVAGSFLGVFIFRRWTKDPIVLNHNQLTGPSTYGILEHQCNIDLSKPFTVKKSWFHFPYRGLKITQKHKEVALSTISIRKSDYTFILSALSKSVSLSQ